MKNTAKLILGLITFWTYAVQAETLPTNVYAIVSDVENDSVPKGYCLIKGKVYEAYSEMAVTAGYVGETSQVRMTKVDSLGNYQIMLPETDSTLFFFHPDYGEIICYNYDFKSQHEVTLNFITGFKRNDNIIYEVEKPVIYLYAEETVTAKLELKPKGSLTFTYPEYQNNWQVSVEGNTIINDGRQYPYLFWEAEMPELNFKGTTKGMEGYFIRTDSTITFLESSLSALGLNQKEQTDFITYWGPRIQAHKYACIQFLIDDSYDEYVAELDVSPKPDAMRRVYMLFKGIDQTIDMNYMITPKLKSFERKGFSVVEWGGSEL